MSELKIFENGVTKKDISDYSETIKQKVESGEIDPVKAVVQAKGLTDLGESIKKNVEPYALHEADKYHGGNFWGAKVELSNSGEQLDFLKDPVYAELDQKLKNRKELLKQVHKSNDEVYDENGAQVPKVPIKKPKQQTLRLTINKE